MSATNRGKMRETNDRYDTPSWCVDRLFGSEDFIERHLANLEKPTEEQAWLEPCVGGGAIIDAVEANGFSPAAWDTVDVEQGQDELTFHGSFLDYKTRERYEVCISNPPFNQAQEIIAQALTLADMTIMLLRVNFLGSEDRHAWWKSMTHKPDIFVLPNRPVFTVNKQGKPGVDATEYAWFVWSDNSAGRWFMLELTSKEERGEHSKKVVAAAVPVYDHAEHCAFHEANADVLTDEECSCLPPIKDLLETLDELGKGRPQIVGKLYESLVDEAPAHGALVGSGSLAQKRVSSHEQLAAVVMELI